MSLLTDEEVKEIRLRVPAVCTHVDLIRHTEKFIESKLEQSKLDAVPEDIRKDAERWRAIVAEAERDYVEVPSHEEPYWQRLECTEAMEEWADAAIAAALKEK